MNQEKRTVENLARRYLMCACGIVIMALGVALSIRAGLGISPISCVPYALNRVSDALTVGQYTIAMHVVLILLQILLLRRRYDPVQLLQLPVALGFGVMTDGAVWLLRGVRCGSYAGQWMLCAAGIFLIGVGVSLEVTARAVPLAGEGVVLAVCRVFGTRFSNTKVGFDVTLVVLASLLSWLFLGGITGVREGTLAAAVLVGLVARQSNRLLARWIPADPDGSQKTRDRRF